MLATPKVVISVRHRVRIHRWVIVSVVPVLAAVTGLMPATAYWSSMGTGATTITTSSLAAPTDIVTPATSGPSVPLSWTASIGSTTPDGYFVTRVTGDSDDPACDSSPSELITGTSCIDSAVADGEYVYIVTAVYRSWTATSTASRNVTVVSPAEMAFTATPTEASAGSPLAPAVEVAVQSATGVTVPTAGIAVSLGIAANPSVGTLSGPTTALTDASGVATFAGLSIDKAGTAYTLTATSDGLAPVTTAPIDIVPAAASTFAITSAAAPGEASSTANLGPVTIETRDAFGNIAPAPSGGITGELSSDSTGTATFSSTPSGPPMTTVTIPEGSSTVSFYYGDTKAGTPTITISGVGFTSGTQTATVAPGDPANLVVAVQPTSTVSGATIAPAVTTLIVDEFGNQTTSTATVTIAIADDAGQGTLGGTLAQQAQDGVAVFDDLVIDGPGAAYTLQLTSPGLIAAITDRFDII